MKLRIADLECESLELSDEEQRPTILKLQRIFGGTGFLEFRDGLSLIHEIAIRKLLAHLEIPIGGDGRLRTDVGATVEHVSCDGRIRNGFVGELRSSILECERVSLDLGVVNAVAHLIAEGLHVKIDGRGGLIEVGTLSLGDAQCTVGSLLIRLGTLVISGLKVEWTDSERPRIGASKASARNLRIERGGTSIHVEVIDLSEGLRVHERVAIPDISMGTIAITLADLRPQEPNTASGSEESAVASETRSSAESGSTIQLDHGLFDTVNGTLAVDTSVSMTLPVIGKRVSIHKFRVPVDGGIINYKELERGLSNLEDAFLDMRVRTGMLVLERDIPLIPGLQKPIVTWPLEPGELELAEQQLVRIGTLLKYQIVGAEHDDGESAKKSRVRLHRLSFDNIAVRLFIDETAVLRSGAGSLRAHADELVVTGSLHYDPDPQAATSPPTVICAGGKGLGIVADEFVIAGHQISAGVRIGSIEKLDLHFDELQPTSLDAIFKNLALNDVDFNLQT